jgi:hypothetical protein
LQVVRVDGEVAVGGHAGIGIALILRDAGLVIAIAASCGAITALVIYGLQLRWALSLYVAGEAKRKEAVAVGSRLRPPLVTPSRGLYLLGLPWQHTRASALLGW